MAVLVIVERSRMMRKALLFILLSIEWYSFAGNLAKDSCIIKNQADYDYLIIEGYRYLLNGNIEMAENIYSKAIQYETCGAAGYFQLSKIKLLKGDIENAKYFAEKAYNIEKNKIYLLNYVNILRITGNKEIAYEILKNCINKGIEDREIFFNYLDILIDIDLRKANVEIGRYKEYINEENYFDLGLKYLFRKKKYLQILKNINKERNISNERKYLEKIKVFLKLDLKDSVIKYFEEIMNLDYNFKKTIAEIIVNEKYDGKHFIIEKYIDNNRYDKEFIKWFIAYTINNADKETLICSGLDKKIYDIKDYVYSDAEYLFRSSLADYYDRIGLVDSFKNELELLHKIESRNIAIYLKLIEIYANKGLWNNILMLIEEAWKNGLEDLRLSYFAGIAYYQKGDTYNAKKYLEICLEQSAYEDFKYIVKSVLAEVYYKMKLFTESDSLFNEIIKYNDKDLTARNNYAYYLALRKENVDFAEKLSRYTIEIDKNNSAFFDTYAWILFIKGDYKNALKYIRKAIKLDGKSFVLWDHYGYILYKNGKIRLAENAWKISCKLNNSNCDIKKKMSEFK
ncbi:MAG: hypothetical protein ACPLXM_09510 [Bacteroidales bacterium]